MATVPHPRTPEDATMARAAAALEDAYPDWRVTVEDARLVARHRHESYDAHREQWGLIATTVRATTAQKMTYRLEAQQWFRWGEVRG